MMEPVIQISIIPNSAVNQHNILKLPRNCVLGRKHVAGLLHFYFAFPSEINKKKHLGKYVLILINRSYKPETNTIFRDYEWMKLTKNSNIPGTCLVAIDYDCFD